MSIPSPDPAKYPLCVYFLLGYLKVKSERRRELSARPVP